MRPNTCIHLFLFLLSKQIKEDFGTNSKTKGLFMLRISFTYDFNMLNTTISYITFGSLMEF